MSWRGERRYTFRLYGDKATDVETAGKMEKLLADGKFRNKNELLRKGIELVYEACYADRSGSTPVVPARFSEPELRELAGMVAEEVASLIGEGVPTGDKCMGDDLPLEAEKLTEGMAVFLSGLNAG